MTTDSLGAIFDILKNNSSDVEEVVQKMGGLGNVIRAAPALIRLGMVVSKHKKPEEIVERIERTVFYNDETKDRVEAFQRKHGLKADGIIGNRTWTAIEKALAK